MKKWLVSILVLSALLLAVCPVAALADLIYTPPDDFLDMHFSECVHLDRDFYVNGKDGFVSVKSAPGSNNEVGTLVNGEVFNVSYTYNQDGAQWGVITRFEKAGQYDELRTGWVPMDMLLLVYDYISFDEDNKGKFYQYSGDCESLLVLGNDIVFWSWPGSGEIVMTQSVRNLDLERNWLVAERAYRDSAGREWGFIPYYYAFRNTWVCLDAPTDRDIPAFNPQPQPKLWNPGESQVSRNWLVIVIISVAAVVLVAAVLICVFWKPKKISAEHSVE